MVQIGKDNPLYNLYTSGKKPINQPVGGQSYTPQKTPQGTDLQARLSAIDNAGAVASTVFNQAASGVQPKDDNLMARLDAIGTGELKPKTSSDFDLMA